MAGPAGSATMTNVRAPRTSSPYRAAAQTKVPAAGPRVGLDVLIARVPVPRVEQPELRLEAAAGEGAEPGAGSGLGQPPPRDHPPLQEARRFVAVEAADGQVDGLPPVGVGVQRPDLG